MTITSTSTGKSGRPVAKQTRSLYATQVRLIGLADLSLLQTFLKATTKVLSKTLLIFTECGPLKKLKKILADKQLELNP
jgi:hypothetical protein